MSQTQNKILTLLINPRVIALKWIHFSVLNTSYYLIISNGQLFDISYEYSKYYHDGSMKRVQLNVEFCNLQCWVSYRRYDKTCHIHSYFYTGIIFSFSCAWLYHELIIKGMNRKHFSNCH